MRPKKGTACAYNKSINERQAMTWLLQNIAILDWHEFDSEDEAREWVDDNILREDRDNWTLIDPEGGDWVV
jgi:hypothetical protein